MVESAPSNSCMVHSVIAHFALWRIIRAKHNMVDTGTKQSKFCWTFWYQIRKIVFFALCMTLILNPSIDVLTPWLPLLPYVYMLCQTGLSRHLTFWHTDAQRWASECPDVKNYKWRLNPVCRHSMLYSCTHMATVGVKGLMIPWPRSINKELLC